MNITYKQACKMAKQNIGTYYQYDAGNGWKGGVHFCARRNRLIFVSINPDGMMV